MTAILAFDTCTPAFSVALNIDGGIHEHFELAPRRHNELILPTIDSLLNAANIKLTDLSAIAFSHGPGSFTGVRVGMSVAQGLCLATELPVIAISSLQALAQLAYRQFQATAVLTALDARMGEVYWARYQLNAEQIMQPILSDALAKPDTIDIATTDNLVGIGSGIDQYPNLFANQLAEIYAEQHPHAHDLAHIALYQFQQDKVQTIDEVTPLYLRNNVVS